MKLATIPGLALAAIAAIGCGSETAPPPPATTMAAQPAATAPGAMGGATSIAAGDFGVPACDRYMRNYSACVDSKVPEAARATMKQQMQQTHLSWKQAASTPEGRAALTTACTQADAAAKQAMASFGCTW